MTFVALLALPLWGTSGEGGGRCLGFEVKAD